MDLKNHGSTRTQKDCYENLWVGQQQYCFKIQTWIKLFSLELGKLSVTQWLSSISYLIGRAEQNKWHKRVDWKAQTRSITALLSPLCVLLRQFCSWNGSRFSAAAHFICLFDFSSAITFCYKTSVAAIKTVVYFKKMFTSLISRQNVSADLFLIIWILWLFAQGPLDSLLLMR